MMHRDYYRNMLFNGVLNKRAPKMWRELPWAIGMPMNGTGYNIKFDDARRKAHHVEFDFTAADSKFPPALLREVAELRASGYEGHDQFKQIAAWIRANYESLQRGAIYSYASGELYAKTIGGTTGQSSVTTDGSPATQLTVMAALAGATGLSIEAVLRKFIIINMNDDGTLHTDMPLTDEIMQSVADWALVNTGQIIRFSPVRDDIHGTSFCKKTLHPWDDYAEEAAQYGIAPQRFAVVHDTRSIMMRQTAVPYSADVRTLYSRLVGHVLLTAHNRALYDALSTEAPLLKRLVAAQKGGKSWLRRHRFPAYGAVMQLHYRELPAWAGMTRHNPWVLYLGYERSLMRGLNNIRQGLRAIGATALLGERPQLNMSYPMMTHNRYIENFAYYSAGEPIDLREVSMPLRTSPFGALASFDVFLSYGPDRRPEARRKAYAAMQYMVVLTAIFIYAIRQLDRFPVIRLVWVAYRTYYLDGAILFGLFSAVVWLGTGESSLALASLIPRDPWMPLKKLAVVVVDIMPRDLLIPVVSPRLLSALATAIEAGATRLVSLQVVEAPGMRHARRFPIDRWAEFFTARVSSRLINNAQTLIYAPTGSGKTTGLLPHLLAATDGLVVICSPTRALRDATASALGIQRLQRGTRVRPKTSYSTTYAHLASRIAHNRAFARSIAGVIMDEVHIEAAAVHYVSRRVSPGFMVGLTATPNKWALRCLNRAMELRPPIVSSFSVTKLEWYGLSAYEAIIRARNRSDICLTRILYITARVSDVYKVLQVFEALRMTAKRWISGDVPPESGHVVASSIAEVGVTLPGVTCIIDAGDMVCSDNGRLIHMNMSPQVSGQRAGRTGRTNAGTYVMLAQPTGVDMEPMPSVEIAMLDPGAWPMMSDVARRPVIVRPNMPGVGEWLTVTHSVLYHCPGLRARPDLEAAAVTLHCRISDEISRRNACNTLRRGVVTDEYEDVLPYGLCMNEGELVARTIEQLSAGDGVRVVTSSGEFIMDRPIVTKNGITDGDMNPKPLENFLPRSHPVSAVVGNTAGAGPDIVGVRPKGSDTTLLDAFGWALQEKGMTAKRWEAAVKTSKAHREHGLVTHQGVDLQSLVDELQHVLHVNIGTKCGFTIVPTNGALGETTVIAARDCYIIGAPQERASYATWDGARVARDPLRGLCTLPASPVGAGTPRSMCMRYAHYEVSRRTANYARHAFDDMIDAPYLQKNAYVMHDKSGTHCMVSTMNGVVGVNRSADDWDLIFQRMVATRQSGPDIDGAGECTIGQWLTHEYNVAIPDKIDVTRDDYRSTLILFANYHHSCVSVMVEDYDEDGHTRVHVQEGFARTMASKRGGSTSTSYREGLSRARLKVSGCWAPTVAGRMTRVHPLPSLRHTKPKLLEFMCHVHVADGHIAPMVITPSTHWGIQPTRVDKLWASRDVKRGLDGFVLLERQLYMPGAIIGKLSASEALVTKGACLPGFPDVTRRGWAAICYARRGLLVHSAGPRIQCQMRHRHSGTRHSNEENNCNLCGSYMRLANGCDGLVVVTADGDLGTVACITPSFASNIHRVVKHGVRTVVEYDRGGHIDTYQADATMVRGATIRVRRPFYGRGNMPASAGVRRARATIKSSLDTRTSVSSMSGFSDIT